MKGQTGVWIDGKKAIIVHLMENTEVMDVLESEVEYRRRYPGETREFTRMGNQFMSNEEKSEEHLRQERKHFLQAVIEKLNPDFDIVIFGPAQTKQELIKILANSHDFASRPITLKPADAMTDKQVIEWVRNYYNQVPA